MKQGLMLSSFFFTCFILLSCKTNYQPQAVQYIDYSIRAGQQSDTNLFKLLQPYADSVNKSMNQVIAQIGVSLDKKQPEGTLNNIVADAMMIMAKQKFNTKIDAAFVNYGGVRLTQIPEGPLTKGKVFELSPFDNTIVLINLPGNKLREFLELVAARGGWPVSGLRMQIANKKLSGVTINGEPLDSTKLYTIATVDYVANGGDNATMLINMPRQDIGYLFRDALLEYFSGLNKEGNQVTARLENRVTVVE